MRPLALILLLVLALRLPFLNHPFQGDDVYYLAKAAHAQVEPLHPANFKIVSLGIEVDMRGFPHPPLNGWFLAGLLWLLGGYREVPFHAAYLVFSLLAAIAAWAIARRLCAHPVWAVLLFVSSPVFVINGTSLEADLPFVALWLAAVALWISGVDTANAKVCAGAMLLAGLASLTAYQGLVLVPVAAAYLVTRRRGFVSGWAALAVPVLMLGAWVLFERWSTGAAPVTVLAGHMTDHALQSAARKLKNAAALTVHLGWIAGLPLAPLHWLAAPVALLGGWFTDPSPLFWAPLAAGAATISELARRRRQFAAQWAAIFFASALILFFAGAARYLLPAVLPLAILAVERHASRPWLIATTVALQLTLSGALAYTNYQQWAQYRAIAREWTPEQAKARSWINGEWGLRVYAESQGAMPVRLGQPVRPGDLVISSQLAFPVPLTTGGGTPVKRAEYAIRPRLPLRLFALDSPSAYSTAGKGLRAFDFSSAPVDIVRVETIAERKPTLAYVEMHDEAAGFHLASGVFAREGNNAWRWAGPRAVVLLARPDTNAAIEATFRLHDANPGRHVTLSLDGKIAAEATYPAAGLYTLRANAAAGADTAVATLTIDRSFRVPGDNRDLGLILTGIGFRAVR